MPTSVISSLERRRFTQAKHDTQHLPFSHLLKPKVGGDYVGDPQMRSRMQAWVNTLWQEKDALIDSLQPGAASEQA